MTAMARCFAGLLAGLCLAGTAGASRAGDPVTTAKALNAQGLALIEQKRFEEAEKPLTAAMALCDGPLHGEHYCVAGAGENLATIAEHRGDLVTAERLLNRAIAVTKAALGDQDHQYGKLQQKLGRVLLEQQRFGPAKTALETGLGVLWNTGDGYNSWIATADISSVYRSTGRPELAGALLEKAVVICQAVGPDCEGNRLMLLGDLLWSLGAFEQGETDMRKAAAQWAQAGSADSEAGALETLAQHLVQNGDHARAEPLMKARYDSLLQTGRGEPAEVAIVEADLAEIYLATGRAALAESMIATATARLNGAEPGVNLGAAWIELGQAQMTAQHFPQAKLLLERALALPSQGTPWWKPQAELSLGLLAFQEARLTEAEGYYRNAAQDLGVLGDVHGQLLALIDLGEVFTRQGRFVEADTTLKNAQAQARARSPLDVLALGESEVALARLENADRRFAEAEAHATDGLAQLRRTGPAAASLLPETLMALGVAEAGAGHLERGAAHVREALQLYRSRTPAAPEAITRAQSVLCDILDIDGHATAAEGCTAPAAERAPKS